ELHQLRGRVGRYNRRAHCYLFIDPDKHLTGDAAKRLQAIEEFSSIGAGFAIAMRDLEIRGAGNILGSQQSGHVAAIGYELYCRLLDQSVRKLKNLPPKDRVEVNLGLPGKAFLPRGYVHDMRAKIDVYRRLSRAVEELELDELTEELTDRFGEPPEETKRLLRFARLRIRAFGWKIEAIHLDGKHAALRYKDKNRVAELVLRSRGALRVVDGRSAYFPLPPKVSQPDVALAELELLLRPEAG
ncbi:MAG: transcription-repair coupling factor, partial [Planctomycetales bacterium]